MTIDRRVKREALLYRVLLSQIPLGYTDDELFKRNCVTASGKDNDRYKYRTFHLPQQFVIRYNKHFRGHEFPNVIQYSKIQPKPNFEESAQEIRDQILAKQRKRYPISATRDFNLAWFFPQTQYTEHFLQLLKRNIYSTQALKRFVNHYAKGYKPIELFVFFDRQHQKCYVVELNVQKDSVFCTITRYNSWQFKPNKMNQSGWLSSDDTKTYLSEYYTFSNQGYYEETSYRFDDRILTTLVKAQNIESIKALIAWFFASIFYDEWNRVNRVFD